MLIKPVRPLFPKSVTLALKSYSTLPEVVPSNPNGTTSGSVLYDLSASVTDLGNNGRTGLISMSSGNALQLIDSPHQSTWTVQEQETQLENGQWYLNIASSAI